MLNALLPKGAPFFELLLRQNQMLCEAVEALAEFIENLENVDKPHEAISDLEIKADRIHLSITRHLSQSFITPIDREDILHINKAQEEAIDLINHLSNRLDILALRRTRPPMLQLARTVRDMVLLTRSMLIGLSEKRDSHNTRGFLALRDKCERLLSTGLGELYNLEESTPGAVLDVIKWSRAYDRMERLVNSIVNLFEAIEEAVLENV